MDNLTTEVITTLQYLLPGFVSAWIFYALTSYPKQSQFERVVQALIFTILIQGIVFALKYISAIILTLPWSSSAGLFVSLIISIFLGLVLSYFSNNDKLHKMLRFLNITKETSYVSEWFGAFSDQITYIVLHLKDGRRIYGWPREWPTEPNSGHFLLQDASWLSDDNTEIQLTSVGGILINSENVEMVEFMKKIEE